MFYVSQRRREFKFDDNRLEYVEYVRTNNTFNWIERIRTKYKKVSEEIKGTTDCNTEIDR